MKALTKYQKELMDLINYEGARIALVGLRHYITVNGVIQGKAIPERTLSLLIEGGHLEYWGDGWRHPLTVNQAKALITKYAATAQVQVRYNIYASLGARQVKRAWLIGTKDTNRLLLPKVYEALRKDGWIGEEIGPRVRPMIYFKAEDLSDV